MATKTKVWYKSKTLWLNILVALVAILGFVLGPDFPVELNVEILKWITFALAVLNGLLRLFSTDSAIKR